MRVRKRLSESESIRFQSEGARGFFGTRESLYKILPHQFLNKNDVNKVTQHQILEKPMLSFLYVFPVKSFFQNHCYHEFINIGF